MTHDEFGFSQGALVGIALSLVLWMTVLGFGFTLLQGWSPWQLTAPTSRRSIPVIGCPCGAARGG